MNMNSQVEIAGVHRPLTAIEVAEDLEAGMNSYGTCSLAAGILRMQHAEIESLQMKLKAAQAALAEAIQDAREAYDKGVEDQVCRDLPDALRCALAEDYGRKHE